MNVQEHETFCEPGLENIRNSEEWWDDVTHRVEETQQELGDDEMMFRKTFHDLFTPADPQTALHTWRTANTAGSHTHTHRPLYSTRLVRGWMTSWRFMYSLRMSCTALYTLKVSRGSGSSLRNVFRITAGTWTSAYWSKSTGLPAHVQMRQIFIDTPTSTQTQWGDFSCFIIVVSPLKEQSTENLCSDWSWNYLSSHQWVGLMLEILKHLLKYFIWTQ